MLARNEGPPGQRALQGGGGHLAGQILDAIDDAAVLIVDGVRTRPGEGQLGAAGHNGLG